VNSNFFGARVYFLRLVQRDVHELQTGQSRRKPQAEQCSSCWHLIKAENEALKSDLHKKWAGA
jgi:hypothetical protein